MVRLFIMDIKRIIFLVSLIPILAWSQAAIAPLPASPGASLMPVNPLRANAVGGGVRIKDLGFIQGPDRDIEDLENIHPIN